MVEGCVPRWVGDVLKCPCCRAVLAVRARGLDGVKLTTDTSYCRHWMVVLVGSQNDGCVEDPEYCRRLGLTYVPDLLDRAVLSWVDEGNHKLMFVVAPRL